MRRTLVALVGVVALAGCGSGSGGTDSGTPATVNVGGTINVDDVAAGLHKCNPRWAESDVVPGTSVTVYDASGRIVGTTTLGYGKPAYTNGTGFKGCAYAYGVNVPASRFYQGAGRHRGEDHVHSGAGDPRR